jgi:hypothetical protein
VFVFVVLVVGEGGGGRVVRITFVVV